ncbi:MAG: 50S ribosomal protein L23 [Bacteroidetes bacterium]|nr:50S ribosomal protein L23 [Bacteroidota bacterium]MBU1422229.1 50S ribosomal protein L23 [Bacteroidota bacterium]MBU2471183.1 50S ribosomal protein L23 [Bacteroidota bacterium]MBU2636094.1 50S ribosomal protein L23 [Bacteroidota bacterium]
MTGILLRPIVTEKMTQLESKHQYAFEVEKNANKIEIQKAIEKQYNVTVLNLRTVNYKGKRKSQLTRRGRFTGKTSSWKKAVVTIKEGEKIEFFENI